ncbi:ABC transporter ATP-binding protein [Oceanobacillus jeddahense]|uniref:ABC transporter ATP-binding protein n=1 Tax=Oceanobacillus jeddahense TaxID=1462527 RepID=UPI000694BEEF|nr:ABC transporter ATP-binding protein [Oceanobacillus jeddahense]
MDIRLEQLSMRFDNITAVDNITTTIKNGELVSLLGPSGCGKSTTLMLLSGLYKPTGGEIYFEDKRVTQLDAEKRGIGMVFQSYALYPHLSVLKNIMFPLKMQKIAKAEAKSRAMEMAKLVKIDHLADRKPAQLSGGQQQRVAIARALVKNPKLLLLDEPLSNLDARLRLKMREEIRRIQQEIGITAVFVTHDQEEALSISDRVMLMSQGKLQQDSTPQDMYRLPGNVFAASFLGNPPINFLDLTKEKAGTYTVKGTNQQVKFGEENIKSYDALKIGLRPEHLEAVEEKAFIGGEVIHIETIGRDTLIRVQQGDVTVRALIDPKIDLQVGDTCNLAIEEKQIHFFDPATNERIGGGAPYDGKVNLEEYI